MKKFLVALMAALTCLACVACAPSNLEKAEEKMKEAGYKVTVMDGDKAKLIAGDDAVGVIIAGDVEFSFTNTDAEFFTAVLFETRDDAKDYYEDIKDEEADEDQVVKQDGKWVYVGTEDAIEDFTK